MGFQPSYRTEAQIYAKYILKEKPNAKIAILYQNDDFGKDYPTGMKDVLGDNFDKMVVTASYETTDPTIDSQITSLQAAGADTTDGNYLFAYAVSKVMFISPSQSIRCTVRESNPRPTGCKPVALPLS